MYPKGEGIVCHRMNGHWMNAFSTWGTSTFMFPQIMNVFMEMVKTPEIGIWMIWNLLIKIQDIGASGIDMD